MAIENKKYAVFIEPVSNGLVGWRRQYSAGEEQAITHTGVKTYQISTVVDFDPANLADIPAHDLAQIAKDTIEHPDAVRRLRAAGVSVLQATAVRPAFQVNGANEYESRPSFDLSLSVEKTYTKTVPEIDDTRAETERV